MTAHPVPRSTYRLQLTADFTFQHAAGLVPYLDDLGISHVYLSPILKARRGSTHGYDTVDHTRISPELGGEDGFRDLASRLKQRGMGIVLDIVPNHMGVGGDENALWLDLLEWGEASRYADWFDINWSPSDPSLTGKLLVPFLGSTYADALGNGALSLRFDAEAGDFSIWAENTHKLPLTPASYHDLPLGLDSPPDATLLAAPGTAAEELKTRLRDLPATAIESLVSEVNASPDRLHKLIQQQHWRPARYSVAADDINYRRFFIVSDLAAVSVERDDVFEHVHRIPLQLVEEGLVDGLRVDHIDGLRDPKAYCLRLRERSPRPIYLVVEKILAPHERLRADWNVDGTTGYEFATAVTQLLTDPTAEASLTRLYKEQAGSQPDVPSIERSTKLGIIDYEMAAELDALTMRLHGLARQNLKSADITRNALRTALRAYVAALPLYRTYVDSDPLHEVDRRNIAVALASARRETPQVDPAVFDFLEQVLLCELASPDGEYDAADVLDIAQRVQQYTGPVMAKGLEDTALYRFHRLISLSDVGEKPDRFGRSIDAFHDFCRAQAAEFPHGLLTTSSHDTKRGEDTRARITVLSGCADEWGDHVRHWTGLLAAAGAPEIDGNDRYYFFQMLLGAWPTEFDPIGELDRDRLARFAERLDAAMLKSVREARQRTNWTVPKSDYEEAVSRYVKTALDPAGDFLTSFRAFERRVGPLGAQNGLAELALKLTVPGVPDIYQGAEYWEQSLVDPDNRRPVDFDRRSATLAAEADLETASRHWRTGSIKQGLAQRLLQLRRDLPDLFADGDYTPLVVDYADDSVLAFTRATKTHTLLVCVRLFPWRPRPWEDARLRLPHPATSWSTRVGTLDREDDTIRVSFDRLPVAIAVATRQP